jgi:hypothetical protein
MSLFEKIDLMDDKRLFHVELTGKGKSLRGRRFPLRHCERPKGAWQSI